jgi:hypothetical protein
LGGGEQLHIKHAEPLLQKSHCYRNIKLDFGKESQAPYLCMQCKVKVNILTSAHRMQEKIYITVLAEDCSLDHSGVYSAEGLAVSLINNFDSTRLSAAAH